MSDITKLFYRKKDVADKIGISIRTLDRWVADGAGPPSVKIGGLALFPAEELDDWIRNLKLTGKR